jgi:hypothetical protein
MRTALVPGRVIVATYYVNESRCHFAEVPLHETLLSCWRCYPARPTLSSLQDKLAQIMLIKRPMSFSRLFERKAPLDMDLEPASPR